MDQLVEFKLGDREFRFFDDEKSRTVGIVAYELAIGDYGIEKISLTPDDVVIDIGANIGMFSVFVSKLQPLAKIYAFEPVVSNYLRLCSNLSVNHVKNVWPFNFGISPEPTFQVGLLHENSGASSEFIAKPDQTMTCRAMRIDDVCKHIGVTKVKWLKIDCEGCEKYMMNSDFSWAEYVSIELHPTACDADALIAKFQKTHGGKFWSKVAV
jgi:FkbM family methyltransferase